MKICKYCVRYKEGFCIMLKQEKDEGGSCKLYESWHDPTPLPTQNKGVKGKISIDWDAYLLDVAKTILPSFADRSAEKAAETSVIYAQALVLKLKGILRQGY